MFESKKLLFFIFCLPGPRISRMFLKGRGGDNLVGQAGNFKRLSFCEELKMEEII